MPGIIGSTGCERVNAWVCALSSTERTTPPTPVPRHSPTTTTPLPLHRVPLRVLHLHTWPDTPQQHTIRKGEEGARDHPPRRDQRTSVARSCSVNTNSAFGRPVLGIQHRLHIVNESQAQDTSYRQWSTVDQRASRPRSDR